MYVYVGLSGRKSRLVMAVCSDPVSKEDFEAISHAYDWVHDHDDVSVVEIWNENENRKIVTLEV